MKHKAINQNFQLGDLVTGIDRSRPRSIYRYEGKSSGEGLFRFVAYQGTKNQNLKKFDPQSETIKQEIKVILKINKTNQDDLYLYNLPINDFRLATPEEIKEALEGRN